MENQNVSERAETILMHSYEWVNSTNCYGYTPRPSSSIEYKKAKKYALLQTGKWTDKSVHQYIKTNL